MKNVKIWQVLLCVVLLGSVPAQAQFLRTSYFMEGSHYRMQLNPALTPGRGYLNLPVIGSFNATVNTSSLGYQDVIDIIDNSSDGDYFMSSDFINRLDATNELNVNLSTDILSAGWYKGKNFWSFNIGLRNDIGASVPRTMFEFMREMNGVDINSIDWSNYNRTVDKESLNINSYAEIGVGFARDINARLTVGGRVKALLGIGNMKLDINKIAVNTNLQGIADVENLDWSRVADDQEYANELAEKIGGTGRIDVEARLESSFKGLELQENEDGYIDEFKFEGDKLGIAGYGAAIDLGASYKLLDRLTLSASILDLGFMKWSKNGTSVATSRSSENLSFDFNQLTLQGKVDEVQRFANVVGSGEVLNFDMLQMQVDENEAKSRSTSLTSTLVIGAEYALLGNWLTVGALYTSRFAKPKTLNELTFSANLRPANSLNLAASYSVLQGSGKTFGVAVKLGPLFVGTDYMYLGENSKNVNAYIGISLPLSKQKKPADI